MKIKEVHVSYGRTVNLGEYNSLRMDAGLVIEVGPDDDPEELFDEGFEQCLDQIESRIADEEDPEDD